MCAHRSWRAAAGGSQYVCTGCGATTGNPGEIMMMRRIAYTEQTEAGLHWERVRPPGGAVAPPPAGPPPLPPGDAGQGGLTVQELGLLRMAGRWGLLRPQRGRRFMLGGAFSMPQADLGQLLQAAGAKPVPPEQFALSTPEAPGFDALVAGRGCSKRLLEKAGEWGVGVLDEQELVLELVPRQSDLLAKPGEPPF